MCLNSAINTNLFQGQQTDIRYYDISFKLLAYHFDKRRLWDRDQCHLMIVMYVTASCLPARIVMNTFDFSVSEKIES